MDDNETFDRGDPIVELPPKWRSLIEGLWANDEKSIGDFLPEIVTLIKATKSASKAQVALFAVLYSSKVRKIHDGTFRLLTPAAPIPDYQAHEIFADAAELPVGNVRRGVLAKFQDFSRGRALTMRDVFTFFQRMGQETDDPSAKRPKQARKQERDDASTERGKRARRIMGVSRRPGRPKKTGHE